MECSSHLKPAMMVTPSQEMATVMHVVSRLVSTALPRMAENAVTHVGRLTPDCPIEPNSNCVGCPAGKYRDFVGSWDLDLDSCLSCAAGTFSSGAEEGTANCARCEAGKYSSSTEATACVPYAAGKATNAEATGCTDCEAGKLSDVGQESCGSVRPCDGGFQRERENETGEVAVGPGSRQPPLCIPCPTGKYKMSQGLWDSECQDCIAGKYAVGAALGCTSFNRCDSGFQLVNPSPVADGFCRACEVGTWNNLANWNAKCEEIPVCSIGRYRQDYNTNGIGYCNPCPRHTYKDFEGDYNSTCIPCQNNSFTSSTGSKLESYCLCGTGWLANDAVPRTPYCIDENECETDTNNCRQYADCTNSQSNFSCTCNRFGYG